MDHLIKALRLAGTGVFALVALHASLAWADPITVTLQTQNTTVTEGNTLTLLFEVTNSSNVTYTYGNTNGQNMDYVSGDKSDQPIFDNFNFSPTGYASCTAQIAAGGSCYFTVTYDTPSSGTDNDSGVYQVLDITGWSTAGQPIDYISSYTNVTVQDSAAIPAAPEPTTLAMLGSSLVGLGLIRRKFRSN